MSATTPPVAILGAGALGAAYARQLYQHDPASVAFIASGERGARLAAEGVIVNGETLTIPVLAPEGPPQPVELIIVALKHQHLADAIPGLARFVGEDTTILSVMNGLDSETMLAAEYGAAHLVYAIAVGIDGVRTGNAVTYSSLGRILFGEAQNATLSPRVQRIQAILERAAIPYETPPDMLRMLWWKFMVNVGVNQTSALLGIPYGVFHTSPHAQAIMEAAMREVIALAEAAGVNLTPDDIPQWYKVLHTLHPEGKTSMLQDVEAGRPTEVDIFAGKVVALGREFAIPTPVNTLLLNAIRVIETRA